jgi:hypothetical protein
MKNIEKFFKDLRAGENWPDTPKKSRGRYYKTDSGLRLSLGNLKIGEDTLILNMGPAYNCPSDRLGKCACSAVCYAKQAEVQYSAVKKYRRAQQQYWLTTSAHNIAQDIIGVLHKYKFNDTWGRRVPIASKIKYLRVNESGDFWSQKCVNKLDHIARELKAYGIHTHTYTARDDLQYQNCHFSVKGSDHGRGNNGRCIVRHPDMIKSNRSIDDSAYVESVDGELINFTVCPGDCSKCTFCKEFNQLNIVFPLHKPGMKNRKPLTGSD